MQACKFGAKFEAWMNTTGKMICLNSKTRMNLYSVLGTNMEENTTSSTVARQRSNDDENDESEAEIIVDTTLILLEINHLEVVNGATRNRQRQGTQV